MLVTWSVVCLLYDTLHRSGSRAGFRRRFGTVVAYSFRNRPL